ncbi:malonate--CoA ligase [Varunaivibrio sulfuroxidans]|uniref:Malonyl-CoA/methylmalonyl-CoA synthetase n=1 Tax=Varunaivibrio sulfuroxidans TaxID=1773489 RepID=A0A4R3JDX9_9PROT|nr:malonyl-CoA synthase [Varunaivibrio sulfuroxidans]TCS63403.1 malonyl-CoA/methylmalonyl-CoA synthetase [Varunaivibrio sulfuroxidans]WES30451.1 malonyl-CoA synthase [Varunaivibrio sulfuroxidans]
MNANLFALLASRFPQNPDADALLIPDGPTLSYGWLDAQTARYAGLLKKIGVEPGARVCVQIEKSPQNLVLYLACLRAGAVYLPLNTAYTPSEVAYFLGDATPRLLVCDPGKLEALRPIAQEAGVVHVLTLGSDGTGDLSEQANVCAPDPWIYDAKPDDLAAILYTSGTTGRSKGAMLSHANLASNALALHQIWGWRPGDVLIHALPIFHVHGLFVAVHCALLNGSAMWFLPKFDAQTVLGLMDRATVIMGVPTFYTRLLALKNLNRESTAAMRLFISGSAPLLAETSDAFAERTGRRILERYGMTEAGMIASNPLDGDRIPATVGYPLPDVAARITDDRGAPLKAGEIGVLEIKGPNVFKGYWKMPEKTAAEFRPDGFFITGDMATIADDGRISIVGRAKDLIISGGFNVYPKEVEQAIDAIPGVIESAVIGLAHPDFGEAVAAVIVADGSAPLDEPSVLAALKDHLARFKQPKAVFFVEELPRNAMGKVQKGQLRQCYEATFQA